MELPAEEAPQPLKKEISQDQSKTQETIQEVYINNMEEDDKQEEVQEPETSVLQQTVELQPEEANQVQESAQDTQKKPQSGMSKRRV